MLIVYTQAPISALSTLDMHYLPRYPLSTGSSVPALAVLAAMLTMLTADCLTHVIWLRMVPALQCLAGGHP